MLFRKQKYVVYENINGKESSANIIKNKFMMLPL